jgi:hypothetical protein
VEKTSIKTIDDTVSKRIGLVHGVDDIFVHGTPVVDEFGINPIS